MEKKRGEKNDSFNGKNVCNTNDYMGDCAECWLSDQDICKDNKLEICTNGETYADAHWVLIEECSNGCNAGGTACN